MSNLRRISIFFLLALVFSVLAATPESEPQSTLANNNTDEPWVEEPWVVELWDGHRPDSWSYTRSLKDWSHCNYSSKQWCAATSVVRWGGKFYDPLSFKGAENDSYGKHLSRNPTLIKFADIVLSRRIPPEHRGCVSPLSESACCVLLIKSIEYQWPKPAMGHSLMSQSSMDLKNTRE
jgi:hypothetical protein